MPVFVVAEDRVISGDSESDDESRGFGQSSDRLKQVLSKVGETPNGDKVIRILKKKLPGFV